MNPLVPWDFEHFDTYLDALNSILKGKEKLR